MKINLQEKFEESDRSWRNKQIRKIERMGIVIKDFNGYYRELIVKFEDGVEEIIKMNNIGEDPEYIHQYEWYDKKKDKWYRF